MSGATPVYVMPAEVTLESATLVEREALTALGAVGDRLVVDLGSCRFICSAGLGVLVKLGKVTSERGGAVVLARPLPLVLRLLRTVGLDQVLPHFPTVAAATAHLDGRGAR